MTKHADVDDATQVRVAAAIADDSTGTWLSPIASAPERAEPLIRISNLHVSFPVRDSTVHAVRGVSFDIFPGQIVALVGESGSGKSVTAKTLLGLNPPSARITADRLHFAGANLLDHRDSDWRRTRGQGIGLVLQDALVSLDPLKRLGAEVGETLQIHGLERGRRSRQERVTHLIESVGIPEPHLRARQYPHELSGGLRQRGLIASGISGEPRVLVADEPTTALDVSVQAQILDLLVQQKQAGLAVLLITHDLSVVNSVADTIHVMRAGQVVEAGAAAEVLATPRHEYTRRLLRSVPTQETRGHYLLKGATGAPVSSSTRVHERQPLPERAPNQLSASAAVSVQGITKRFGRGRNRITAVNDVSFTIAPGQTLGVVGESGSGKSTVARIILGLVTPDEGDVLLLDQPWSSVPERRRRTFRNRVQVVAQDPLSSFDPRYDVGRIVSEAARLVRHEQGTHHERVIEALGHVGLGTEFLARHPRSLSGGQRQRVAIARALVTEPDIVITDEPLSALDVSIQAQILDLLAELRAELGVTFLLITHDLGVVNHFADRVVVMHQGRVVEQGDVEQVFAQPTHPYTQRLLRSARHI